MSSVGEKDIYPGITETLYIWHVLIPPTEYFDDVAHDKSKNQWSSWNVLTFFFGMFLWYSFWVQQKTLIFAPKIFAQHSRGIGFGKSKNTYAYFKSLLRKMVS